MNEETKQRLVNGVAAVVLVVLSSLATQIGNCSAGIATKGDVDKAAARLEQQIAQCARQDQLQAVVGPAQDGKPATISDRISSLENGAHVRDERLALEVRRGVAADVAFWRLLQTRLERDTWVRTRDAALDKWDGMPGRPLDQVAEAVQRSAGVPR